MIKPRKHHRLADSLLQPS